MQAEKEKMRGFGERAVIDEKGRLSFDIENSLDCLTELPALTPGLASRKEDDKKIIDEED